MMPLLDFLSLRDNFVLKLNQVSTDNSYLVNHLLLFCLLGCLKFRWHFCEIKTLFFFTGNEEGQFTLLQYLVYWLDLVSEQSISLLCVILLNLLSQLRKRHESNCWKNFLRSLNILRSWWALTKTLTLTIFKIYNFSS